MDKYGQNKEAKFISGSRLNIARKIKGLTLKALADKFNSNYLNIQKWQHRGIPSKSIIPVCNLFQVDEWVFFDEFLSDNDFTKIISNPSLQKKYHPYSRTKNIESPRWLTSYRVDYVEPEKGTLFKSDIFHISCKTILIRTKLWNVKGGDYIAVSLHKKDKKYNSTSSAMSLPSPQFNIWTNKNTKPSEVKIEDNFIHNIKKGNYYLFVYCKYKSEISVYEMEKLPNIKKTITEQNKNNQLYK